MCLISLYMYMCIKLHVHVHMCLITLYMYMCIKLHVHVHMCLISLYMYMCIKLHVHVHMCLIMARRAIPMIAFPRVRCMFIYIYVCVTYTSMRCIRS